MQNNCNYELRKMNKSKKCNVQISNLETKRIIMHNQID